MSYKSIRIPSSFVDNIKPIANKEFRTVPQQIMYWAELGKEVELRQWQIEKMYKGLSQAKKDIIVSENEMEAVFQQCIEKCQ